MRQRAMLRRIDFGNDAIANRDDGRATRRGKIYAEVQALPSAIGRITLKVGTECVAIALTEIPCACARRISKGQLKRMSGSGSRRGRDANRLSPNRSGDPQRRS